GRVSAHLEYAQIDYGMLDQQLVNDEERERHERHEGERENPMRTKPILFLTFVQHYLQGANSYRQHADAPVVDTLRLPPDVGGIKDEEPRHDDRGDAHRNVDVEHPAPT